MDRVNILDFKQIRLIKEPVPALTKEEKHAVDHRWDEEVRANPNLFDGPVIACLKANADEAGQLTFTWARTTYRRYAAHRVPGDGWLPVLFVGIAQPTDEGSLLLGRMSKSTSGAGRWQLPGGIIETSDEGEALTEAVVQQNAARELAEEIGIQVKPEDLTLWCITRGVRGSIGLHFLAPRQPESLLRKSYSALATAEEERGLTAEFDQLAFVHTENEIAGLGGTCQDYVPLVVRRHAAGD